MEVRKVHVLALTGTKRSIGRCSKEELFRGGETKGRPRSALGGLTDILLIELDALEIYYRKPAIKSIVPAGNSCDASRKSKPLSN